MGDTVRKKDRVIERMVANEEAEHVAHLNDQVKHHNDALLAAPNNEELESVCLDELDGASSLIECDNAPIKQKIIEREITVRKQKPKKKEKNPLMGYLSFAIILALILINVKMWMD